MGYQSNYPHIVQDFQIFYCFNCSFENREVEELTEDKGIEILRREETNSENEIPNTLISIESFGNFIIIEF
jgi:hypothetical protein